MIDFTRTGERIARLRRGAGLTQAQLAERADVTRETLARWETGGGKLSPNAKMLLRLAGFFHVSVEELLCPEEPEPKNEGGSQP